MRKKLLVASLVLLSMISISAAQGVQIQDEESTLNVSQGLFGPDSFLYPAQLAVDEVTLNEDEYMARRAIEARNSLARNKSEASERALRELNREIEDSSSNQSKGLEMASNILEEDLDVPEEAQQGINTALENIEKAAERTPEEARQQNKDEEMEEIPDIELGGQGQNPSAP